MGASELDRAVKLVSQGDAGMGDRTDRIDQTDRTDQAGLTQEKRQEKVLRVVVAENQRGVD
jgi:hypothetical protein